MHAHWEIVVPPLRCAAVVTACLFRSSNDVPDDAACTLRTTSVTSVESCPRPNAVSVSGSSRWEEEAGAASIARCLLVLHQHMRSAVVTADESGCDR